MTENWTTEIQTHRNLRLSLTRNRQSAATHRIKKLRNGAPGCYKSGIVKTVMACVAANQMEKDRGTSTYTEPPQGKQEVYAYAISHWQAQIDEKKYSAAKV